MTSSSLQKILFLGATGYIGGSVLQKFLHHPRAAEFHITALVRDPVKAEKLKAFSVIPFIGDNSNLELLQTLAQNADVVLSVADNNDVSAMKATLVGARTQFQNTGRPTTYIHTSGAGIIADRTVNGMHDASPIYDDLDSVQMATIAPEQLHRPVDLELLKADDEGYVKSYIIIPTTVYGIPTGPLVDCGIQKRQTTVLPWLIKASLLRGQGGMVGEGRNIWHNVEISELAGLYVHLYDAISKLSEPAHGRLGLYFAENGAHALSEIGSIIARVLYENGKGRSPIPSPFTAAETEEHLSRPLAALIGSNAKCRANRAQELGWRPTKSTSALMASVEDVTTRIISSPDSL